MNQAKIYSLEETKRLIMYWRATRTKRRPIPDEVWEAVLPLIGRYSYSIISKELGLSYQQIKTRIKSEKENAKSAPNSFISIALPQEITPVPKASNGCKISFTKPDGTTLAIEGASDHFLNEMVTRFVVPRC
jgi:hypothetical protein